MNNWWDFPSHYYPFSYRRSETNSVVAPWNWTSKRLLSPCGLDPTGTRKETLCWRVWTVELPAVKAGSRTAGPERTFLASSSVKEDDWDGNPKEGPTTRGSTGESTGGGRRRNNNAYARNVSRTRARLWKEQSKNSQRKSKLAVIFLVKTCCQLTLPLKGLKGQRPLTSTLNPITILSPLNLY